MAERLPLIPRKKDQLCSDVQSIFREVFRDLEGFPPLVDKKQYKDLDAALYSIQEPLNKGDANWIINYEEELKTLTNQERQLKFDYAKKLSLRPPDNIYKVYSPRDSLLRAGREEGARVLGREHLMPHITHCYRDSLWIKNTLNSRSEQASQLDVTGARVLPPIRLDVANDKGSQQDLSIGEHRRPQTHFGPSRAAAPPAPAPPAYVCCLPSELYFVNFTVGKEHVSVVRVINMSKKEVRLSLTPPARKELTVEIDSPRGLTLTSGAECRLRVHFRPADVRPFSDVLAVRVSRGAGHRIPVYCYMEPPLLTVLVPSTVTARSDPLSSSSSAVSQHTQAEDVVDLGARLLGDVHAVDLLLHSHSDHAAFFILTEEDWLSFTLEAVSARGRVLAEPFAWQPAYWRGGGRVRGRVQCRAPALGLHVRALRLLASTAVTRCLHLIADSLCYSSQHISIQAHDKDYDICSEYDDACEYYLNLGIGFPGRTLTGSLLVINHSPVSYTYYWSVRQWGVAIPCKVAATGEEEEVGEGEGEGEAEEEELAGIVLLNPPAGALQPRSTNIVQVRVPDAGGARGLRRIALVLTLQNIPKESIPEDLYERIVKVNILSELDILGTKTYTREVCDVICAQLEVWWEVVPVRFVLEPCLIILPHSRSVTHVDLKLCATQQCGADRVATAWAVPPSVPLPAAAPLLTPDLSQPVTIRVPLPSMPDCEFHMDVLTLTMKDDEWMTSTRVIRSCHPRYPALRPTSVWFKSVAPGSQLQKTFRIINNTHQPMLWKVTPCQWMGESDCNVTLKHCFCEECHSSACRCLSPHTMLHGKYHDMYYDCSAPHKDGAMLTLVQLKRSESVEDESKFTTVGCEGRAALFACRVLAPQVTLRVFPCEGEKADDACGGCALDGDPKKGSLVLRPAKPLVLGARTCYRVIFTNHTPILTRITCYSPLDGEGVLHVAFEPDEFDLGSYRQVTVRLTLHGMCVCRRRLWICQCKVKFAYAPIYLVIDTEISGLQVSFEVPIGSEYPTADTVLSIRKSQKEDSIRKLWLPRPGGGRRTESKIWKKEVKPCDCPKEYVYIEPPKKSKPTDDSNSEQMEEIEEMPEIVTEPPSLLEVCPCTMKIKPVVPQLEEPICLQFRGVPLRTVQERRIVIRNTSTLYGSWSASVRRFQKQRARANYTDKWAGGVGPSGLALQCHPSSGMLIAQGLIEVTIRLYSDSWGLYNDQIMFEVDCLEPIILDVWAEVLGCPLTIPSLLKSDRCRDADDIGYTLWMTASDPERTLRIKNISRTTLNLQIYVLRETEMIQDWLPLRLLWRYTAVPMPPSCHCLDVLNKSEDTLDLQSTSDDDISDNFATKIELFLSPDYGEQESDYFQVEPDFMTLEPNCIVECNVKFYPKAIMDDFVTPPSAMLIRMIPQDKAGVGWYRPEPMPLLVHLREAFRTGVLYITCDEVHIKVCVLDLPYNDIMRVRKHFSVKNVGSAPMRLRAVSAAPWGVLRRADAGACGSGCGCAPRPRACERLPLDLPAHTSQELSAEVTIKTEAAWSLIMGYDNDGGPSYPQKQLSETTLTFYKDDEIVRTIPLILELQYPVLVVEPRAVDFGCVTDGDTRKTYITVTHTHPSARVPIDIEQSGTGQYNVWPLRLLLAAGVRSRVYIQYTARWESSGAIEECALLLRIMSVQPPYAGACAARLAVRGEPSRDVKFRLPPHDHTDDRRLVAPALAALPK